MPVTWIQRVYESGKIYGETVPFNRIDTSDANTLVFAKTLGGNERTKALKIPADSVYPKHGVIAGTDTGAIAVFTHREYQSRRQRVLRDLSRRNLVRKDDGRR